eukprot:CAMPEP_0117588480 /NCGR_PEP_ID=MMETSP0784-20121206/69875_1 /TAXON_ID=39447 /ORGANISM="" /LENGTH=398 /DNA_ID=CAMNT_0005389845 /DNA_START=93 /DNA_END=1289 /DNA_ORIENTATION=-
MVRDGDWAGLTVAVTGACGNYGASLVRALVRAGAQVRALDIRHDDSLGFLAEAEAAGKAKFICCNLCADDASSLIEALKGVSVVFHTIAYFGDPPFASRQFANPGNAENMTAVNVTCVDRLLAVARDCGVLGFVHTSTLHTLLTGRVELVDVNEKAPYAKPEDCIDLYSVTKAEGERLVLRANGQGGMNTASVRANGIYAPSVRCIGIMRMLQTLAPIRGLFFYFLDREGREPLVDWCHAENLAMLQMLVAKQLLANNSVVCGSIYHASDDVVSTNVEFFAPIIRGAGWSYHPVLPLPALLIQSIAYLLEVSCYGVRRVTGCRCVVPPINCLEAAKVTMSNYQNIEKAKAELGFVAIPQEDLMKDMAMFARRWVDMNCAIPHVPLVLWAAMVSVCPGS